MDDIGYAIDFKEIKRVGCQWIDDILDHGAILNPKDGVMIKASNELGSKIWLMSLNGAKEYCNPSAENIAKEIYLAMQILFYSYADKLRIHKVTLWETPNCCTTCIADSISSKEWNNFNSERRWEIASYAEAKGIMEYDDRKI